MIFNSCNVQNKGWCVTRAIIPSAPNIASLPWFNSDASNPDVEKLLSKLNVTGYPAIFVMDNGEVVKQYEGGRSEQDLLTEVSSM